MAKINQNPEQIARDRIDKMLEQAGWVVQSQKNLNWGAGLGIAIKEYPTDSGPADYVLFVDRKPVGVIEAKREDEGHHLTVVEDQTVRYATGKLKYLDNDPLPFVYESTGLITRFRDYRDPKPRGREVFSFHQPKAMKEWLKIEKSLRGRLLDMPNLDIEGLRLAQIRAIENLEHSYKENRPKALIQMATGAGKTFTAVTFLYRLLSKAKAKRVLFLVDTRNLGEQAEQEFMKYQPQDDNRKFTELFNVQLLKSNYIASDSDVCISTIQRLFSILKGEELEDSAEMDNPNESSWMQQQIKIKEPLPVIYNEQIPIEMFDFVVIDECHRSIYNLWKQVLDYFDSFLIGLTATPDKRTFGFFNENVVSEYTYEESVADGVNVPYDIYTIETKISKQGATIEKGWYLDKRDKLTRKKRWEQMDEEKIYVKNELDRKVVSKSQIRTIIKEFRKALRTEIYPDRFDKDGNYEVPKTLIFAKTDSHADDIIKIVREEFNEGDDFCKKVTYKVDEDPKSILNRFRNSYNPRIAVTVDMIATGTDVKPLEVLLFMRDVRSTNYFEQMKGRGTRTIDKDKLKEVSATARAKTNFVIVDAVGVTKSKKTDSRPLERKRSVLMKDLLGAVTMNVQEEDVFLSLANRLIRLDKQITDKENVRIKELSGGKNLKQITRELLEAHDQVVIADKARELKKSDDLPSLDFAKEEAQKQLLNIASSTFNGELNDYLDNVRKIHDQIIDHKNLDEVTISEWDGATKDKAEKMVIDFTEYLEAHKDEIIALSIFFDQPYRRREITFRMIKEVYEKISIDKPFLAPQNVWEAYCTMDDVHSKLPGKELTALVSLIRRACGIDTTLTAYDKKIDENFKQWIFRQNAGQHNRFNDEQMNWLRLLKNHVLESFHLEVEDLDYTPFDAEGGRGKMYQLFGDDMNEIINELNEVLAV
ncbi:DEAD/DEAH box helicase family protein [Methanococcoides sp. SA1]|nr:DEAD/DEAH box helicase family protein [Methanococcoides sp. SA1]